ARISEDTTRLKAINKAANTARCNAIERNTPSRDPCSSDSILNVTRSAILNVLVVIRPVLLKMTWHRRRNRLRSLLFHCWFGHKADVSAGLFVEIKYVRDYSVRSLAVPSDINPPLAGLAQLLRQQRRKIVDVDLFGFSLRA